MSAHRKAVPALLTVIALAAPLADQAQAQSIWLPGGDQPSISLEAFKPILAEGNDRWSAATAAFVLSGRMPVATNVMITAELPFAHAGLKLDMPGEAIRRTNTIIGNPYVGIQYGGAASAVTADAGIRIPVRGESDAELGDFAAGVGAFADLDRMEAYMEDIVSVVGRIGVQQRMESGLVLRARGGPALWYYTVSSDELFEVENKVMLDYSAQAGYEAQRFSILGGLTGRTILTGEGSFQERSFHQLGMSGSVSMAGVKPGVSLRVPIDDEFGDMLRYVVGVHLTVPLGFGRN